MLSGNGFLLSFGLEAHPCSAFTSPSANMAQPENQRVAVGAARRLSRRQGDCGDGAVTRKSRLAAEELWGWIAEVQRSPLPHVLVNPQTLAGVGAAPRERRAPAAGGSVGRDGAPALCCFFSYLGCRTWDAGTCCRTTLLPALGKVFQCGAGFPFIIVVLQKHSSWEAVVKYITLGSGGMSCRASENGLLWPLGPFCSS